MRHQVVRVEDAPAAVRENGPEAGLDIAQRVVAEAVLAVANPGVAAAGTAGLAADAGEAAAQAAAPAAGAGPAAKEKTLQRQQHRLANLLDLHQHHHLEELPDKDTVPSC